MTMQWPQLLWIVRHGESAGNVARAAADAARAHVIDLPVRDVDVPLSELGERQAAALGRWFASLPAEERPEVVFSSPFLRARRTAEHILAAGGGAEPGIAIVADERLREREFGILDRLTGVGIRERFPEQFEHYRLLGKFYHRPPGGESWCDVILRLRGALDSICLHHAGDRVLVVAHEVVVLCLRYLIENMDEVQILAIDRDTPVANCGVTRYDLDSTRDRHGALALAVFNFVAPLEAAGEIVTTSKDAPVAAK